MVRQPTGSSRTKESSMDVVRMALYSFEDLLYLIGVFGTSADPDTGIGIGREFGAAEEEGIDLIEVDAMEVDLWDADIEAMRF